MNDNQIADFIKSVSKAGGELTIAPNDWLNPECGYYANIKLPSGNSVGFTEAYGYGQNGITALTDLVKRSPPLPSPIG